MPSCDGSALKQDVRFATLLSELVYRAAESPDEAAFRQAQATVEEELGASLSHVRCHKSGGQRFLVGESDVAIYVAFQGTKSATDWLANLNFFHGHFGCHHQSSGTSSGSSSSSDSFTSTSSSSTSTGSARAHIGFLKRANSAAVTISALHTAAAAAGKRLVLTGHSLGGAVAALTTVRLLRALVAGQQKSSSCKQSLLNTDAEPRIRCISFATPAVANSDLLQEVTAAGWDQFITNIVMPEDPVVPFVNLLLKAPAAPCSPVTTGKGLFMSSGSSSSTPSSISTRASDLSRSNSNDSQLSVDNSSWDPSLQFEPISLPADLATGFTAAGTAAAAALQPLQDQLQAAAGSWFNPGASTGLSLSQQGAQSGLGFAFATQAAGPGLANAGEAGSGSSELASWLAAARGAVKQRKAYQASLADSSRRHSSSTSSLSSLQSDASSAFWPASKSEASSSGSGLTAASLHSDLDPRMHAAAAAAACNWPFMGTNSSLSAAAATHNPAGALDASKAAGAGAAMSQQGKLHLGSQVMRQVRRIQQQLLFFKASRLAWISGMLAAGVRCAAAFTGPQLLSTQQLSLLAMVPRALAGPAALAAIHLVSQAAYQAALPPSHPLGQQWVMTGSGLELFVKPIAAYPRNAEGLGLKELGGLFPGHRMIAYRRRLATLVGQNPAQQQ